MTNVIAPRRTDTPSKVPTTSDLQDGELGVNVADGKIYQRMGSTIYLVGEVGGWSPGGTSSQFVLGDGSYSNITALGKTIVAEASTGDVRNTLGLGNLATLNTIGNAQWAGGPLSIANGGTGNTSGNAATATTLATARTLTIGSTGKSFDGSANVSWSLADIGAVATGTTVNMTGNQTGIAGNKSWTGSHTFTGGMSLGSTIAASTSNLSSHLSLYSNTYGFNVTGNRLNAVVPTGAVFTFVRDGVDVAGISHIGVTSSSFNLPANNGDGLKFWGGGNNYSIWMSNASDSTYGGRAPGETASDFNMYFNMSNSASRGFVFCNTYTPVAGIDGAGSGYFTSHVYSQDGAFFDSRGNVRKLPFNTQNANYTFTANDFNGAVEKSNNSNYTYTLNNIGSQAQAITVVNSGTAGNITIARGSGVALYRNGVNANITVGPGSMITIYRSANSGRWIA